MAREWRAAAHVMDRALDDLAAAERLASACAPRSDSARLTPLAYLPPAFHAVVRAPTIDALKALVVTLASVCWRVAQPDLHPLTAPAERALGNALPEEAQQIMTVLGEQVDLAPVRSRAMDASALAENDVARQASAHDLRWWFAPYLSNAAAHMRGAAAYPYVASLLA